MTWRRSGDDRIRRVWRSAGRAVRGGDKTSSRTRGHAVAFRSRLNCATKTCAAATAAAAVGRTRILFDDASPIPPPWRATVVFRAHPPPPPPRPPKRVPRKPRTTTIASFTARAARRHKYALSGVSGPAFEWIPFAFIISYYDV